MDSSQALADAVALWESAAARDASDLIGAAVEALVDGMDSPSLRELAGARPTESYWVLRPLVQTCLRELDIDYPGPQGDALQLAAARAMCRRLLAAAITPRELARWAHAVIGHEGALELQPLVELDDHYDGAGQYFGRPAAALDDIAHAEAQTLLNGARPH